ncbi:FG-GAP-like repeat-containing protein [Pseudotenacibaculum haliotis]|uniref:FG-GAP-like repeat-containing protein n=1 Tax=Pseudotenacibaculum haliotis TaxID=1862138 RepID=A0ABW5LW09_9FLAO
MKNYKSPYSMALYAIFHKKKTVLQLYWVQQFFNFYSRFFCVTFLFFLISNFATAQFTFVHKGSLAGFAELKENNGVSVADYDGDLDLDVFVVAKGYDDNGKPETISKLFRNNNNGTFTDVTEESGLTDLLSPEEVPSMFDNYDGLAGEKYGAFWGDYDNDGDPDLFFTHLAKVQLFRNQGDGTFVDVTQQAGILEINNCGNTVATWFDFNNDRFLDLYISDWRYCENTLYQNNGDGTFTNVTVSSGIQTEPALPSFVPFPFDFNKDGLMDLYLTNDLSKPNDLFINLSGSTFEERAEDFGINTAGDDMGMTMGDYNNDGHFDIFITAIDQNFLLTNNGNNTFMDKASVNFVDNSGWGWGATFADFDLDGDEDLMVVNGYDYPTQNRSAELNFYYENKYAQGGNHFVSNTTNGAVELAISVEALDFDYDNDGDLDLFITNSDRRSSFYHNNTIEDSNSSLTWFQVQLQGTLSNRDAIGTILTLTTTTGTIKRYYTGVGFLGQSLKPVHFGLNGETEITELKIEWPSGHVDTHQNLTANTFIRAVENQGFTTLNIAPAETIEGCTDPNSCNFNPQATINNGSCVYLTATESIVGENNPGYLSIEEYSYSLAIGNTMTWEVEGGEIIEGQGTGSIKVKWGLSENASIKAILSSSLCNSDELNFDVVLGVNNLEEDKSIARLWNEVLLEAIRNDYARPTVHARNLFHTSIAMYDAWAIYSDEARPYLIGNSQNTINAFQPFSVNQTIETSRNTTISYAVYRLLKYRFRNSPHANETSDLLDRVMNQLEYDIHMTNTDFSDGNAAALGNYIAEQIIAYGHQDGARELSGYDNGYYEPINEPLAPILPGNSTINDPNRWQSLSLDTFIDQSGNLIAGSTIDFLSPEWGNVTPFALSNVVKQSYERDGNTYHVYHDPGIPPYLGGSSQAMDEAYKWGFSKVSIWSSHLDPEDGVLWDISPASIGNIAIEDFPTSHLQYPSFYDLINGGDIGEGYGFNPKTGQPYQPQIVPRGDYARVLAEFWADGPDSETPPGHWFSILNYVNDHSLFEKKLEGVGEELDPLEWDVKAYFAMGGAMHDAAISAWSVKGWYDYVRPISAIRYMADKGQSTDQNLPSYHEHGIPLRSGYVELVDENDPLAGRYGENIGKIKVKAWRGHGYIGNTATDVAGVDWILAENWWPYQRPSFVTPPFAGYVSGHSTYSRAAAEVMTLLTGDAFFPGGMGEFVAKKDEFLVFEDGPSTDVILQWATYRDASDQCSLSRIWGGIHPPADDIPGRLIGERIGIESYSYAKSFFQGKRFSTFVLGDASIYPNPVDRMGEVTILNTRTDDAYTLYNLLGKSIAVTWSFDADTNTTKVDIPIVSKGLYVLKNRNGESWKLLVK